MTVCLVVLDGFGIGDDPARDALQAAPMWNWHRVLAEFLAVPLGEVLEVLLVDWRMPDVDMATQIPVLFSRLPTQCI